MLRILTSVVAVIMLLATAPTALALSDAGDVGKFHGVWIGTGVIAERQGSAVRARDLDVVIRATETGFEMTWKSLGRVGAERIRVRFVATSEPNVFTANSVDPPLSGKEKLWAQMEGDRLVVYLSSVGDDGAESVTRHQLSVSDGRMSLRYTLSRGGEVLESVTGNLSKAKIAL